MSEVSEIIEYIGNIFKAYTGTILSFSDNGQIAYFLNVNEPFDFDLASITLPYAQIIAPTARPITKTRNVEQLQNEFTFTVFFKVPESVGAPNSLEVIQYKHDACAEMRKILDLIERNQIDDPTAPDIWIDSPYQLTLEKSTLYSNPDDLYPPWMITVNISINHDEEY
jgi:hypothetical protein